MTWTILPAGHLGLDRIQEAPVAVALHVAADDGPVEDVERSKQGRGAMALVVVRHGAEPALLQRQARQGAIESLDLALRVERKHDGLGRRIDIEPNHVVQLVDEVRIVRELGLPITVRLKPVGAFQMRRTALALMPLARAPADGILL